MKYSILITGSTGFVGQHLINKLPKEKFDIFCVSRKFSQDFIDKYSKFCKLIEIDIIDSNKTNETILQISPDYVIHLASSKSRSNNTEVIRNIFDYNFNSSLNLFESLLKNKNLRRLIVFGSIEEYGDGKSPFFENQHETPNSIYGLSKLSVTKLANIFYREYNLPVIVLRPSIIYGPNQNIDMFIPSLINALINKKYFKMTLGEQFRDFIYIDDLIDAVLNTIYLDRNSELAFNIASGVSYKLKDIATKIAVKLNALDYLKIGAKKYRNIEIMDYSVNISKAKLHLNWQPNTSIEEGINLTISSFNE